MSLHIINFYMALLLFFDQLIQIVTSEYIKKIFLIENVFFLYVYESSFVFLPFSLLLPSLLMPFERPIVYHSC